MARQISLKSEVPLIAPSILAADPLDIRGGIGSLEGQHDWIHFDVMDGHFVPNLSYGPSLAGAIRRAYPEEIIDVHLMVRPPEDFIDSFIQQKPDFLTVHVEATPHLHRVLSEIRKRGIRPGVVLNPSTPIEWVRPVLHMVDMVLIMSVNPGFGGQRFIPEVLSKVTALCRWREAEGLDYLVEIDGGVGKDNVKKVVQAGCDVLVMGSAVFGTEHPAETIKEMRKIAREARVRG